MAAPKTEPKIFVGIVLDFETGGLDCTKSACTQIAMHAVRMDNWQIIDRYVRYIQPYEKQEIGGPAKRKVLKNKRELELEGFGRSQPMGYDQEALTYSGITMDMLVKQGVNIHEIAKDIIRFGERCTLTKGKQTKPVLIGQNITFDIGFLHQIINYAGLIKDFEKVFAGTTDFYGNFQPHYIDTIDLGRLCFAHNPEVTSYKLELLAERLGIELEDAHDADADVEATHHVIAVCSNRLRMNGEGGETLLPKKEKTRVHFKI